MPLLEEATVLNSACAGVPQEEPSAGALYVDGRSLQALPQDPSGDPSGTGTSTGAGWALFAVP